MTDYERKLTASAAKLLRPELDGAIPAGDVMRRARRFLKVEEHRIRLAHKAGESGLAVCRMRSAMIDVLIRYLWERNLALQSDTARKLPISVVADGGYGRQVMNPGSDIDLLFLFPGNSAVIGADASKLIGDFLMFLYDLKFKVGHGTNTVGDIIRLANSDNETKTALIESRLIAAQPGAFEELRRRFDKECMEKREIEFLRLRQDDLAQRHQKHENTPFVQEPQVKTGCGGLRDYQNIIWMTYAKLRTLDLRILVDKDLLSRGGLKEIQQAYDFLLRVRTEMHTIEKRASDQLTLRLQGVVATNLGYRHKTILRRIEAFMRDYYIHTRNILQRSSEVMDGFHLQAAEQTSKPLPLLGFLSRKNKDKVEKFDGFISRNDRLFAEHERIFKDDPGRLMRMFRHAQLRRLRLSPALFKLVQSSFRLVGQSFRYNKENREMFESILSQKGDVGRALRQMHRVGFLGKYMPEFGHLTCLVQHEFFHRYTADEHTLRTIDRLDELSGASGEDRKLEFYQHLFHQMQEPWILYLALLLHDTGRAANTRAHDDASAVLADAVTRRLQIKGDRRRLLMFLVNNHLLLYRTATGKSLEDPKVVEDFCGIVRTKEHLDALLVMTVADSKGTSEQNWTGYKETSIRYLYSSAVMCLNAPADFMKTACVPLDTLREEVLAELGESFTRDVDAHFAAMPRSYFNFREAGSIAGHIRQFRDFFVRLAEGDSTSSLLPVMRWIDHTEQGHSSLIVTSWDRHLLLARLAGALAAESINILSAKLYQRSDNLVLDIFRVCTTSLTAVNSARTKQKVEKAVNEAFACEGFDFTERIHLKKKGGAVLDQVMSAIPQRVFVNNELSQDNTVIELQAIDRLGLLYDIFTSIGRLGHNITHARINTEAGVAIDTIYVQDRSGFKITCRETLLRLKESIETAVFGEENPSAS